MAVPLRVHLADQQLQLDFAHSSARAGLRLEALQPLHGLRRPFVRNECRREASQLRKRRGFGRLDCLFVGRHGTSVVRQSTSSIRLQISSLLDCPQSVDVELLTDLRKGISAEATIESAPRPARLWSLSAQPLSSAQPSCSTS